MKGAALSIDYTGEHGGQLAMAFAAGCLACSVFWGGVGKFMWSILGKAKDDQIAHQKQTIEDLTDRIKQLETLLLLHGPGNLREDLQKALADMELRLADREGRR